MVMSLALVFVATINLMLPPLNGYTDLISKIKESPNYVEITDSYDLGGKTVSLPDGIVIVFRGGEIRNGELVCKNASFSGKNGLASNMILKGCKMDKISSLPKCRHCP